MIVLKISAVDFSETSENIRSSRPQSCRAFVLCDRPRIFVGCDIFS
jgi:hypothetical protein